MSNTDASGVCREDPGKFTLWAVAVTMLLQPLCTVVWLRVLNGLDSETFGYGGAAFLLVSAVPSLALVQGWMFAYLAAIRAYQAWGLRPAGDQSHEDVDRLASRRFGSGAQYLQYAWTLQVLVWVFAVLGTLLQALRPR